MSKCLPNRTYEVEHQGRTYIRNRRLLRCSKATVTDTAPVTPRPLPPTSPHVAPAAPRTPPPASLDTAPVEPETVSRYVTRHGRTVKPVVNLNL